MPGKMFMRWLETQPPLIRAAIEAVLAAALALLLAVPIMGLRTTESPGGLRIDLHAERVARLVLWVAAGRFALTYWRCVRGPGGRAQSDGMARIAYLLERSIGPVLIVAALILPLLPFADRWVVDTGIVVITYTMLAWGLNIVVGYAGLLDLGFVAFYAVGAYATALLALHWDWGFWACLPVAGALAASFGVALGFPVLRLRGDYFAIVTLGFGEIIRIVLLNWVAVTNGPNGIGNIPRPDFFGLNFARNPPEGSASFAATFGLEFSSLHRIIFFYYVILFLALLTAFVSTRLRNLPIGRAWEALREDDIACQALGIDRTKVKLTAFAVGAFFGGLAGSFFAVRQGFISPESFSFIESAIVLGLVVLGGMGSHLGIVLATIFVIGIQEAARDFADYRMLMFGACMVLIMLWKPRGLLSFRVPSVLLHKKGRA